MNKKGFTLVELLAIIVILGIIITIVYPLVVSTINDAKKNAYTSQKEIVIKAAKLYYLDHVENLPDIGSSENRCVTIETLITDGYISSEELKSNYSMIKEEKKLINPDNNTEISSVQVKYENNKYVYNLVESCS